MTSPGGPVRVTGPVPGAAGTGRPVDDAPEPEDEPAGPGETLRSVPDPPAEDPEDDDASETSETPSTAGGDAGSVDSAEPEDPGSWSGVDTGTVRRSRPSRSPRAGVPTPPSPMNAADTGMANGAGDPPRRPVPPTFPSAGQPPPAVARRQGRHAKPERAGASVHTPPSGYRPRHAAPDAETEQFAATPVTGPGGTGPMPLVAPDGSGLPGGPGHAAAAAVAGHAAATASTALHTSPGLVIPPMPDADDHADRVRVVLAERRVPTRAVRTVAEIEQQTETGELLLRNLLRAQLALGLRLGLVAVFVLGALPVLFLVLPRAGTVDVAGVTLPWIVLGFLPYPFMLALAWLYTRTAERNELDFADNVED